MRQGLCLTNRLNYLFEMTKSEKILTIVFIILSILGLVAVMMEAANL